MIQPESDLTKLLCTLQPALQPGVYAFTTIAPDAPVLLADVVATFREAEGLTVVAEEPVVARHGWPILMRAAWITLTVHSDLHAVGLTAAFATALGRAGISCNVLAAAHHDHIFVPFEDGERALAALVALQREALAAARD
ncbi:ACT domain-containing protein [Burkholderia oklahomensis]|uniref:ACT domain-containing protein n=1 Tax=Burkholderia oklahomensis TaxID=342113 RepID=UPI00016A90B0|nr:ACT domain-containing protein [Burkholderia oklahomensis]AJX31224.1 ACT domain protein [Burkholderia oklahomensis C6786]AOI45681.1 acetyltransferase [Burkholderia oklahomensis C6786]KUY64861.1 acetyltransferase [Burkholderia oklahomensis C6786]MBI0361796.1 ACT domain-containing protein [Burkholderia oklahomensis]MDN7671836.1 ACT domain-containing protein [Burkholderia oklahomensis]